MTSPTRLLIQRDREHAGAGLCDQLARSGLTSARVWLRSPADLPRRELTDSAAGVVLLDYALESRANRALDAKLLDWLAELIARGVPVLALGQGAVLFNRACGAQTRELQPQRGWLRLRPDPKHKLAGMEIDSDARVLIDRTHASSIPAGADILATATTRANAVPEAMLYRLDRSLVLNFAAPDSSAAYQHRLKRWRVEPFAASAERQTVAELEHAATTHLPGAMHLLEQACQSWLSL